MLVDLSTLALELAPSGSELTFELSKLCTLMVGCPDSLGLGERPLVGGDGGRGLAGNSGIFACWFVVSRHSYSVVGGPVATQPRE